MMSKFNPGDYVSIVTKEGDVVDQAIVKGSYAFLYGGSGTDQYSLTPKHGGKCAWFDEDELTLIETGRFDILEEWEQERERLVKIRSNLDWIFANGKEVLSSPYHASVQALASCFGLMDLWGANGEGITYMINARCTLDMATPFLESGDKNAWLAFCGGINDEI